MLTFLLLQNTNRTTSVRQLLANSLRRSYCLRHSLMTNVDGHLYSTSSKKRRMPDWRTKSEEDEEKRTSDFPLFASWSLRQGAWFSVIHINKAMLKIKHSPQLFAPRTLKRYRQIHICIPLSQTSLQQDFKESGYVALVLWSLHLGHLKNINRISTRTALLVFYIEDVCVTLQKLHQNEQNAEGNMVL